MQLSKAALKNRVQKGYGNLVSNAFSDAAFI